MAQSLIKIYILRINAFALSGRTNDNTIHTQGVASLALGYALIGLSARALAKSETIIEQGLCAHWALPFRYAPATFGSARLKLNPKH